MVIFVAQDMVDVDRARSRKGDIGSAVSDAGSMIPIDNLNHLFRSQTLGVGSTFAKGVGSVAQGLDAGIHLGYRWSL